MIAVVGSRSLDQSWLCRIDSIVGSLLSRGHSVSSGGALGADLFALRSLVGRGQSACSGSVVFLPGQIDCAPSACRSWLLRFSRLGGQVVPGPASFHSPRCDFISALFSRSVSLVRRSSGVVAFVSGRSAGSWFTCQEAAKIGLPVVVFPVEGPGGLRSLGSGQWVGLHSWDGAFRWVPSNKEVRHAEI